MLEIGPNSLGALQGLYQIITKSLDNLTQHQAAADARDATRLKLDAERLQWEKDVDKRQKEKELLQDKVRLEIEIAKNTQLTLNEFLRKPPEEQIRDVNLYGFTQEQKLALIGSANSKLLSELKDLDPSEIARRATHVHPYNTLDPEAVQHIIQYAVDKN
ncbi:hypothetical protein AGMMS49949_09370 [Alphaproteobacteria bacterium]|nr:hypothetical protein AGMMS49949_09370 [Alphaproteobacteria bacterium]GHT00559.1 hypothetical protein AGMMS50296_8890 [Alphaproteobacteria bacterium]